MDSFCKFVVALKFPFSVRQQFVHSVNRLKNPTSFRISFQLDNNLDLPYVKCMTNNMDQKEPNSWQTIKICLWIIYSNHKQFMI